MTLDPRLAADEQTVAQAAISAGFLTPSELEEAILARDAQRRAGQAISLLPLLAQRLRPDQLAHLRGVHQRSTGRLAPLPPVGTSSGKRLGRYAVIRELGAGGMGAVYLAQDPELDRQVAVKVVLPGADAETLERTRLEAQAAARLDHPGIVRLHTVERDAANRLLIALEVIEGGSLSDRLKREGPLPPRDAAALMVQVARAMQYAHDRGVLHRDLKPANILLTEDGCPKVTDFGLAKHQDDDQGLTKTGVIMGSPGYMAPEQAAGEKERVDARADVYGLGATLFALLTGRPPFQGPLVSIVSNLLTKEAPTARSINPAVDPALSAICAAALAREPEARIPRAGTLADELEAYLGGEATPRRRGPARAIGAAAVLLTGSLVGYLLHASAREGEPEPTTAEERTEPTPATSPRTGLAILDLGADWPIALTLDGSTLRSDQLPGLEVWGLRLIREEPAGGIMMRGTAQTTAELNLPVDYSGGAFRLELTGKLRQLERRNRLALTLHAWPVDEGPPTAALAGVVHGAVREGSKNPLFVVWKGGVNAMEPEVGTPEVERAPDAPFRLVLTYSSDSKEFGMRLSGAAGRTWFQRTGPRLPLSEGAYRLRLGANLRGRVRYEGLQWGWSGYGPPADAVFDVRDLKLVVRTRESRTFRPRSGAGRIAELGRLSRAALDPERQDTAHKRLEALASLGKAPEPARTPEDRRIGIESTTLARYLLAGVLEAKGELEEAAKCYSALNTALSLTSSRPRVLTQLHAAWSREVFAAPKAMLAALAQAHSSWGLTREEPAVRVERLTLPRGGTRPKGELRRLSDEELIVSGSPEKAAEWRTKAGNYASYLTRYRFAEALVLLHGRASPNGRLEAPAWYVLGDLERSERLFRGLLEGSSSPKLQRWARGYLGRIALRLARWKSCRDQLARLPQPTDTELSLLREAERPR